MNTVESFILEGKSFEVSYSNDVPMVQSYKGVSKTIVSKDELKGFKKSKSKVDPKLVKIVREICKVLMDNKISFKVIFIKKDVEIRFDLDHYVHIYEDGRISIAGFSSDGERPLSLIYSILDSTGEVRFLRPLR
jgi:hypothetical protein